MKTVTLGEIANITSGGTPSRKEKSYWGGNIPWVTTSLIQNKTIVADDIEEWITEEGMKKSSAKMVPAGTILMAMYGQGKTRGQVAILNIDATINQACAAISINSDVDRDFVYQQLLYRYDDIRKLSNSGGQENLSSGLIKRIAFPIGSMKEQKKIASILTDTDHAIETTERLIAAKERYFDGLLSRMIHKETYTKKHISLITREISIRNKNSCERVLSVTNKSGFVLPEDQFERRVASENVSNYKLVTKGQYAYNPSRINVGSIARLDDWDEGILSPMYTIFELDASKVNSDFFLHWLSSHPAKQRIKKSAQGSVRETVSFGDFGSILIPLPDLDEQKQISEVLNTIKREIDLLKKLAESYRLQKLGLMQKLLSGEWRVTA